MNNSIKSIGLQFFAEPEPATDPTPNTAQQPVTPPQAVNVDINAIIAQAETKASEAAEKKMEGVFKSMLQQQGLDAETINKMTAEWKSKQITPEQTIQQLTKERDDGFASRDAKIAAFERERVLRGHGLTDSEDIEVYGIRINKLVADGKTFEQAAQEYFTAHPRPTKVPATATFDGAGRTPIAPTELDGLKADYAKAVKERNHAEMSRLTRLAHEKNIKIT